MNSIFLSGMVKRVYWAPAGTKAKSGRISKYPRLSVVVTWNNVSVFAGGQQYMIENQESWISMGTPTLKGTSGNNRQVDVQKVEAFKGRATGQSPYMMLVDGTYHVWGNPPKQEIKVGFWDVRTGQQPLPALNKVVITGQGGSQNEQWLYVEERYHVPGTGPKAGWQTRLIPVFLPQPMASLQGQRVIVFGTLSAHALVKDQGGQFVLNKYLHVVAEEIHAC